MSNQGKSDNQLGGSYIGCLGSLVGIIVVILVLVVLGRPKNGPEYYNAHVEHAEEAGKKAMEEAK